jgi:hypothetical protein
MTNSLHGRVYTTTPGAAFTPPLSTRLYLGNLDIGGNAWNGVIKGACGDSTPGKCASSTNLGFGDVAFVGDSITLGDTSSPTRPPYVAATTARRVGINLGIGGYTAAQCRAMYEASVVGKGYGTVVLACSVNSINNGLTAAQTWVDLQAVADSAIGAGLHVVLMKTTPWATYAGWSAAKQTHTDDLWTTMQAYCSAHSSDATCVSTDSLGTGSPLALAAGYDYGDHLHLNAAGSTALGVLMAGGIP